MACEAGEQVLVEILKQERSAEYAKQLEKAIAAMGLLRSDMRIRDWGAMRLAPLIRIWITTRSLNPCCSNNARNDAAARRKPASLA